MCWYHAASSKISIVWRVNGDTAHKLGFYFDSVYDVSAFMNPVEVIHLLSGELAWKPEDWQVCHKAHIINRAAVFAIQFCATLAHGCLYSERHNQFIHAINKLLVCVCERAMSSFVNSTVRVHKPLKQGEPLWQ
ncbi:MAG: hypothetical protein BWY95_01893 [Bacteroidetes bacterium ADurb.BinA104]|nr:MAG: hypothetical protein BWY95_01893 [Bacteroidetes bacterium ADurb.BinA104]